MPVRWSLLLLLLLILISFLALSKISSSSLRFEQDASTTPATSRSISWGSRWRSMNAAKRSPSSLQLHHLQEEQHLRSRSAQILQDLEENDLQFELDCSTPLSASDPTLQILSREEQLLQEADFEFELALEVQRLIQRHQYDSTVLNESPSALQRHLERNLRKQKRLISAHRTSLHHQPGLLYNSQECIAWRARQSSSAVAAQRLMKGQSHAKTAEMTATLGALGQKRYKDPNGFLVELDPIKVLAGSRRASTYENDDLHVLVLDMQWDPEVTVVVGNVLDETVKLRQEGYRPVMLNVGDSLVPGGAGLETREKEGGVGGVQFLEGEDEILRRRILAAMRVGASEGHDALVLPPHGTEVGQNPPEAIAAIYRSIIGRDFMGGRKRFQTYKKIVMVLDPEQAHKIVNETSSYRPLQPVNPITTPLPIQEEKPEPSDDDREVERSDQEDQGEQGNQDDQDGQGEKGGQEDQDDQEDPEKQEDQKDQDDQNDQSVQDDQDNQGGQGDQDDETLNESATLERRYVQDDSNDQEAISFEDDDMEEQGTQEKIAAKDLRSKVSSKETDGSNDWQPEEDNDETVYDESTDNPAKSDLNEGVDKDEHVDQETDDGEDQESESE
ncbi:hypothetical protein BGZ65_001605, partial [Modicella reniformis]